MLDFDYMAPEIIVNAVRLISGGEPIKIRGVVYVPERTCVIEDSHIIEWHDGNQWETRLSCGDTILDYDDEPITVGMYCKYCGAKVVSE